MTIRTDIRAVGIKDALRELNTIDKRARRAVTRDYNEIVQPIVRDAKTLVPREAPLSGFERSWSPGGRGELLPWGVNNASRRPKVPANWQQSKQGRKQYRNAVLYDAKIRAYVSGKKPISSGGYTRNLAAFGVRWLGYESVLFDTSGHARTRQGQQMVAALTAKFGPPSRAMWRAYERSANDVQRSMRKLVERVMREVGRDLA